MAENTENVKKIRELEDFDASVQLSEKDYLIVATNEDADGDGTNERVPLTKKATIAQAVETYNNSIAQPPAIDSGTGLPAEPDPEEQPGYEETDPGTGETVKRITTPVNGGNLDNFVHSDSGIEVVDFCQNENKAEVKCNGTEGAVKYKTKKLKLSRTAQVQYIYSQINISGGASEPMASGGTYTLPILKHAIKSNIPGHPENLVKNGPGTLLENCQYLGDSQKDSPATATPANTYHYFAMTKAHNPYNPFMFDLHGMMYTQPATARSVDRQYEDPGFYGHISNWIGFASSNAGGTSADFNGFMYVASQFNGEKGEMEIWGYLNDINSWIFFDNGTFPSFYIATRNDFSNLARVGWYKWEQKTGDDPKKKYLTNNVWSYSDNAWYSIQDPNFDTNPAPVNGIESPTDSAPEGTPSSDTPTIG